MHGGLARRFTRLWYAHISIATPHNAQRVYLCFVCPANYTTFELLETVWRPTRRRDFPFFDRGAVRKAQDSTPKLVARPTVLNSRVQCSTVIAL